MAKDKDYYFIVNVHSCQYCYQKTMETLQQCKPISTMNIILVGEHKLEKLKVPVGQLLYDPEERLLRLYGRATGLFMVRNTPEGFEHTDINSNNLYNVLQRFFTCQ